MKNVDSIVHTINNTAFHSCEEVKCGDSLYYLFALEKDEKPARQFLKAVKKLIRVMILEEYRFERAGEGNTLFLFSGSGGRRKDLQENFRNVVRIAQNRILMEPDEARHLDLVRLKYLKEVCLWLKDLSKSGFSLSMKLRVIAALLESYASYDTIKRRVDLDKIRNFVTLCDVTIVDSFIVQKFNHLGKTTVTLQHGTVSSLANSWALTGSKSKYFFVCNQFTINEGKMAGYKNTMQLVGFYGRVNRPVREKEFIKEIKVIGAFADGTYDDDNFDMIDVLLEYCRMSGCALKIKFHPTNDLEKYQSRYAGKDVVFVEKGLSVQAFCDEVDVTVTRNSTTVIESLQYGTPAYIIHSDRQAVDVYKYVDILKFDTAKDLYGLLNQRTLADVRNDLNQGRDLFCCAGDITERYAKAFEALGIS